MGSWRRKNNGEEAYEAAWHQQQLNKGVPGVKKRGNDGNDGVYNSAPRRNRREISNQSMRKQWRNGIW